MRLTPTMPGLLDSLSFRELGPGVGAGTPAPAGWRSLVECPLLILVGVTGVGKSTTLSELAASLPFTLLPDRRKLTDDLIIAAARAADGLAPGPVQNRKERFAYTRRFRDEHPGGMADVLPGLSVKSDTQLFVFDGLRGENEVRAASSTLPRAHFVLLDAPDSVRVSRLLGRGDSFDQVTNSASVASQPLPEGAELILSDAERAHLFALVESGAFAFEDLRAKVEIVLEERRNYDPGATRQALLECARERTLLVDTTRQSARTAAFRIGDAVRSWFPHLDFSHKR